MSVFRLQNLQMAIAIAFLCPSISYALQSDNDVFDPTLDRPLAQYESTSDVGFDTVLNSKPSKPVNNSPTPVAAPPVRVTTQPAQTTQPNSQTTTSRPRSIGDSGGIELAPNPLANPGSVAPVPSKKIDVGSSPWNPPKAEPTPKAPMKTVPKAQPKSAPATKAPKRSLKSFSNKGSSGNKMADKPKAKKNAKKEVHAPPELTYNIYRDTTTYPLDPRKPNNPCTKGYGCGCGHCGVQKTGIHGRPYQPNEPGGYRCGKNCPNKRPEFSIYWPRPFSVKREDCQSGCRCTECCGPTKKINDLFDGLSNFRLIDYHRTDNGYCGPESDPYGCLGESKVAGLGFRSQGAPVAPSSAYPLR